MNLKEQEFGLLSVLSFCTSRSTGILWRARGEMRNGSMLRRSPVQFLYKGTVKTSDEIERLIKAQQQ